MVEPPPVVVIAECRVIKSDIFGASIMIDNARIAFSMVESSAIVLIRFWHYWRPARAKILLVLIL